MAATLKQNLLTIFQNYMYRNCKEGVTGARSGPHGRNESKNTAIPRCVIFTHTCTTHTHYEPQKIIAWMSLGQFTIWLKCSKYGVLTPPLSDGNQLLSTAENWWRQWHAYTCSSSTWDQSVIMSVCSPRPWRQTIFIQQQARRRLRKTSASEDD